MSKLIHSRLIDRWGKGLDIILGLGMVVHISLRPGSGEGRAQGMFGVAPYFDELFYAGFNIEGYELGLDPAASSTPPGPGGAVAYWRVEDIELGVGRFTETGAEV